MKYDRVDEEKKDYFAFVEFEKNYVKSGEEEASRLCHDIVNEIYNDIVWLYFEYSSTLQQGNEVERATKLFIAKCCEVIWYILCSETNETTLLLYPLEFEHSNTQENVSEWSEAETEAEAEAETETVAKTEAGTENMLNVKRLCFMSPFRPLSKLPNILPLHQNFCVKPKHFICEPFFLVFLCLITTTAIFLMFVRFLFFQVSLIIVFLQDQILRQNILSNLASVMPFLTKKKLP
ncbi:hypothetical protein RFI_00413 [Reticulomyxa filosa]|uniref:Uncharacterized protein n=1 Tax=Reticulomyxa filosa TaxID=46433 RepID=X6PF19_RETFI|nr:hypothetical protein RFI_00413 [Reticulomyxa filosa]|eukprot:ETO36649.1 hypothetical protein RFI_00413 [Reticulomyxa filosa]